MQKNSEQGTLNNVIIIQKTNYDPQNPKEGEISPFIHYINFCKVYFAEFDLIVIKGQGEQIYTAIVVAENLVRKGFAEWKKLETGTFETEKNGRITKVTQVVAVLTKSKFFGQKLIEEAKIDKNKRTDGYRRPQQSPSKQQRDERPKPRDERPRLGSGYRDDNYEPENQGRGQGRDQQRETQGREKGRYHEREHQGRGGGFRDQQRETQGKEGGRDQQREPQGRGGRDNNEDNILFDIMSHREQHRDQMGQRDQREEQGRSKRETGRDEETKQEQAPSRGNR